MKRSLAVSLLTAVASASLAYGTVFINEIYINPPGSQDDFREFIELLGTPGMKLDGYALAFAAGGQQKYYPLGSLNAGSKPEFPEIDELFALDGLSLGANGLLVVGVGNANLFPTLLPDSNHVNRNTLWNGGLDTTGNVQNDGSMTSFLIRRRPGNTPANPNSPLGLRWGKDIAPDDQLITPAIDPQTLQAVDQYGDGGVDRGEPSGFGGNTLDLRGASTLADTSDDLEIVDEVSYEHDRGWEYDIDDRRVDIGNSTLGGLPERKVHALDDPQGLNPDALTRVDYRTSGPGWPPSPGAVGELPNGNNWQDTATEQWIRGESLQGTGGAGANPQFFYDNGANANPDAIQPFFTLVPLWLNDGVGSNYNYTAANTYQIMAGRINPLAVAFIPGDTDRDGDCDAADIAKLAARFGSADYLFSNSFAQAPEGNDGDPATQTRPWDIDLTGNNGIEPSDLQWVLNFQGNTNGQIVGRTYDSTTPAATGVFLNSNAGTNVQVSASANDTSLTIGQTAQVTVSGQVVAGSNNTAGQQNGVMQFVHDVAISAGGVLEITAIAPAAPFSTTNTALVELLGVDGDLGAANLNGYTTSFTQGLGSAAPLYVVSVQAVAAGNATLTVGPAADFTSSTPRGLKIGHTTSNGDPAQAAYPAGIAFTVSGAAPCPGDVNGDGVVNDSDLGLLLSAFDSCPGDGQYNPAANFATADPCVNDSDLGILLNNFNAACP